MAKIMKITDLTPAPYNPRKMQAAHFCFNCGQIRTDDEIPAEMRCYCADIHGQWMEIFIRGRPSGWMLIDSEMIVKLGAVE